MDKRNPIFRSLEIIEKRIMEKLSVENIANSIYFSKYHYGRLFHDIVGDNVMEYVTKRKLTLAGRALLETDATILDIALMFGFDSHEGFSRSFKSYMGITPKAYRKYGLAAIAKKLGKEKRVMTYSKATDGIVRELNDFIVKARETANGARKIQAPESAPFWNTIAGATDSFADRVKIVLERIALIAEQPDEITNRFTYMKAIEDIAFQSNFLAFNAALTLSRSQTEQSAEQKQVCEKYTELARASSVKAEKISRFFSELSSLIFEDMRKTAVERIKDAAQKGRAAAESIIGYSYIKEEVEGLADRLSQTPLDEITVSELDECIFKLSLISFAIEMDTCQKTEDRAMFDALTPFRESLYESVGFFKTLIKPDDNNTLERVKSDFLPDIAYQVNVLLFYLRGEISQEKTGRLFSGEQKAAFNEICGKINSFIKFTHKASAETAYKEIADVLFEISADMTRVTEGLNEHGGPIKLLSGEFKGLANYLIKFHKG